MPTRENPEIHSVFCGLNWLSEDQTVRHVCIKEFGHAGSHECKCGMSLLP